MEEERLIKPTQVMYHLGCSRSYLQTLAKQGKLRPIKIGNRLKYSSTELKSLIERIKKESRNIVDSGTVFINCLLK